jgi:GH43 family beta-xylosidase
MLMIITMGLGIIKNVKKQASRLHAVNFTVVVIVVGGLGLLTILASHADTFRASSDAEAGQVTGNAGIIPDATAYGGNVIRFGLKNPNPKARNLIIPGLADPDIYKESDNLFFVSGTRQNPYEPFPIYQSTDLSSFTQLRTYNPSNHDPAHDYCYMWAPDITKQANLYYFYFTARVVDKGAACPAVNTEPTTFYATAADNTLDFGLPQYINKDSTDPRTYPSPGCPDDGCDHAIRIDAALFNDGKREWLHYVWFDSRYGNVIWAFPLDDPGAGFRVSQPVNPDEEGTNEAPFVLSRNGKFYLFYSQGNYAGQYAMSYIISDSVASLTRSSSKSNPTTIYKFSTPLRAGDGKLLENHGHNSIVERGGRYYVLYHIGEFDSAGKFTGARSTYIQPLSFKADGTLNSLNTVDLQWPSAKDSTYSLDVKTTDGNWVTGCVGDKLLLDKTSFTFNDVCTSITPGNPIVHKYNVTAFRINYLANGAVTKSLEKPYDGVADTLNLQ